MRSPRSQNALAVGAHDDEHERVGDLYERYAPRVAAYAMRRASRADANDVVAETFLVAWRKRDQIPSEPMALPWLYGVARRVLANQNRSRHRRTRLHDRLTSQFTHHQAASSRLEAAEGFERVAAALTKLSVDDAEILRLTAWEDLSPAEIASMLNIEPEAVRQRLHRARKRFRKQLAGTEPYVRSTRTDARTRPAVVRQPIATAHLGTLGFEGGGHRG